MEKLYDVEVTVSQVRRYRVPANNEGTAETIVANLVEDDPKGLDADIEWEVLESISEDVTAYVSEEE